MHKLADGTEVGYEAAWRQWVTYRTLQEKPVYLEGRDVEEKRQDEDALIAFCVYLGRVFQRTYSTLQQKLFAIRFAHLVAGYDDPVLHRKRLWATLSGLKREQDPTKRKLPVTPKMLCWLKNYMEGDRSLKAPDKAAAWGAIAIAFFFMLRASEYLVRSNLPDSYGKVLRGCDVVGRRGNESEHWFKAAEEVVIQIPVSYTHLTLPTILLV